MNKNILKLIILFTFLFSYNSIHAQDAEKRKAQFTPEQRADRMSNHLQSNLSLTDEQKQKVKDLFLEQEKKREADQTKRKETREEMDKSLTKIFTPEQMEKYKKMEADRRGKIMEKRKERKHIEDMPPAPEQK